MSIHDDPVIQPGSASQWSQWLHDNHAQARGVWLRMDDRTGRSGGLSYDEAVCEALRFGWVDGQTKAKHIRFTPRTSTSAWAATNKARVKQLEIDGRMEAPGRAAIEAAKANGMWSILDGPEAGIEPHALRESLDAEPNARTFWDALPSSARKYALTQIALARRDETKAARIAAIVNRCAAGERPDR